MTEEWLTSIGKYSTGIRFLHRNLTTWELKSEERIEISFLGDLDLNKMNTARDIWQIKYLSDVSIYITVRASFTDLNDKYSDFRVFVLKDILFI